MQLELGAWLKPGVTGGECFERGYDHISRYLTNFPREFVGHGLGLNPHEQPRMNRVNRTVLEPNTVICIEYSYYHDGVRHHTEDTFLMTGRGRRALDRGLPARARRAGLGPANSAVTVAEEIQPGGGGRRSVGKVIHGWAPP